jgi:hypothetical protein
MPLEKEAAGNLYIAFDFTFIKGVKLGLSH